MSFLVNEDGALRKLLQGMTVTDQKSENEDKPRPVRVYFGQPDQEITAQNYPYITIDMLDVQRDTQREMRGRIKAPDYLVPEGYTWAGGTEIDIPIPVNIDYQITTYARHPRHDRELLAQVLYQKLPFRFGTLSTDDNTVRRLDVLDVVKRDVTEQAKRLFVNSITVRVSSEIAQSTLRKIYKVQEVHVDEPVSTRDNPFNGAGSFIISE